MALDKNEVLEGLIEIIVDETGADPGDIDPDKTFADDLDIDSLSMMTILTLAEDRFDVEIPDDSIQTLQTVQDAVDFIAGD
ncbi:MAG: acyl carrier protein [Bifidobacteriaceae bacterium]|jgi:acyl carrier protein|nr:acyl carrier protein [Bifidobacteriaceae bacterium]